MFGNRSNDGAPPNPPTPSEPKLVPQRKFWVEYVDGSGVAQRDVITCRLISQVGGLLVFSDAVGVSGNYSEFVVLCVLMTRVVRYSEVVTLAGSELTH